MLVAAGAAPVAAAGALDQAHARGTLRLLWLPDAAPFSYALNGQPAGYEVELCRRIAALVAPGLKPEWQAVGLDGGLKAIAQGQGDLLCGPVTITLGRLGQMDFTSPIFIGGPGLLLRDDASPLLAQWFDPQQAVEPSWRSLELETAAPRRIAVQQGSTGAAWLQDKVARNGLDVTVVLVPSDEEAASLLVAGVVEGWVSERAVLAYSAVENPALRDCSLVPLRESGEPLAIAMPRDPQLSAAVEAALAQIIRGADFDALLGTWFGTAAATDADAIRGATPLE
jgi:ABC-type amino acid transport substrate-binding protein